MCTLWHIRDYLIISQCISIYYAKKTSTSFQDLIYISFHKLQNKQNFYSAIGFFFFKLLTQLETVSSLKFCLNVNNAPTLLSFINFSVKCDFSINSTFMLVWFLDSHRPQWDLILTAIWIKLQQISNSHNLKILQTN